MTTLSAAQPLSRPQAQSALRTAFDRLIEARHLQARRYLSTLSAHGYDRFDIADVDRRSLFDITGPERN